MTRITGVRFELCVLDLQGSFGRLDLHLCSTSAHVRHRIHPFLLVFQPNVPYSTSSHRAPRSARLCIYVTNESWHCCAHLLLPLWDNGSTFNFNKVLSWASFSNLCSVNLSTINLWCSNSRSNTLHVLPPHVSSNLRTIPKICDAINCCLQQESLWFLASLLSAAARTFTSCGGTSLPSIVLSY